MMPWPRASARGPADGAAVFLNSWMDQLQRKEARQNEIARRHIDEALSRTGGSLQKHTNGAHVLMGASGAPMTTDEQAAFVAVLETVHAEYAEEEKRQLDARAASRAEAVRVAAEIAAAQAAPYREERRRRKAEAFAKRQPKP